jgi:hypothetical protein
MSMILAFNDLLKDVQALRRQIQDKFQKALEEAVRQSRFEDNGIVGIKVVVLESELRASEQTVISYVDDVRFVYSDGSEVSYQDTDNDVLVNLGMDIHLFGEYLDDSAYEAKYKKG